MSDRIARAGRTARIGRVRSSRSARFALVTLIAIAGQSAAVGLARAADLPVSRPSAHFSIDAPSVLRYALPPGFQLTGTTVLQGIAAPDGTCLFKDGGRGVSAASRHVELAFDPATCQDLMATGAPDRSAAVPPPPQCLSCFPFGMHYVHSLHTYSYDPVGIKTTELTSKLDYYNQAPNNPQCLNGSAPNTATVAPNWFAESGWQLEQATTGINPVIITGCAPSWTINSTAHYINPVFCKTITVGNVTTPTEVWHDPVFVVGYPSGLYDWGYSFRKAGGCNNLLSYGYDPS